MIFPDCRMGRLFLIARRDSMTSSQLVRHGGMTKSERTRSKAGKDGRKNTSLRLDSRKLKALKIRAIEDDTSVQKIVETLIDAYLAQDKR